ncbi:MAG: hypothetical protein Q8O43_10295 [Dehalococcoidia bacterium]|nr:hypothetical protein [Dehalococcoidia bacterium]
MIAYKPGRGEDESETVYVCDNCGGLSNFSDYWWPGHRHWKELDFTLCNDCIRVYGIRIPVNNSSSTEKRTPTQNYERTGKE